MTHREPTTIQLWQHTASGEKYAARADRDGNILNATGPLHHSEIEAAMSGNFDGDIDTIEDLTQNRELYTMIEERAE